MESKIDTYPKLKALARLKLFAVVIIVAATIIGCEEQSVEIASNDVPAYLVPPAELVYGFSPETHELEFETIKSGEFLADLFLKNGFNYQEIDRLVRSTKGQFNPRNIRIGAQYAFVNPKGSNVPEAFIYRDGPIHYSVIHLGDSIYAEKGQKEVDIQERQVSGTIESSLYLTLQKLEASPALAVEMANVLAWTIDFYRLQKGDKFSVIFEEKFVDEEFVGIGEIYSMRFDHSGQPFYAFQFETDNGKSYYNEDRMSMRKAFLKSPLKFGRMTSAYTRRRFHPVQKRWKAHLGTDYAAPRGTPILATGDGRVTEARRSKYNGRYVKIKHNSVYTTQYLHMNGFAKGVRAGSYVRQGQVIGYVGSTGLATGPHVCYRFWKNGKQVDARRQKLPPAEPLVKKCHENYDSFMSNHKQKLDNGFASRPQLAYIFKLNF